MLCIRAITKLFLLRIENPDGAIDANGANDRSLQ